MRTIRITVRYTPFIETWYRPSYRDEEEKRKAYNSAQGIAQQIKTCLKSLYGGRITTEIIPVLFEANINDNVVAVIEIQAKPPFNKEERDEIYWFLRNEVLSSPFILLFRDGEDEV